MTRHGKAPRVPPWTGVELPVLDETLCTGCRLCPEVCPTACLTMGPHHPWLLRAADCVSCEICVQICPAAALRLAVIA
jgi:formate hydrogenlyase subunit 6/NADH:ubiquinone oxidoreductase subunit I